MTALTTDARVLEIAGKFEQYPDSDFATLRGPGIVQFARALLAEHEGAQIAAAVERGGAYCGGVAV